jgi:excisionase family DNA binding protein
MADPLSELIKVAVREVLAETIKTTDLRSQRLLSPEQTAEYINCSRARVYELLKEGEIPVVKSGRSTLIDKDDLEKWITAHKRNGEDKRVA